MYRGLVQCAVGHACLEHLLAVFVLLAIENGLDRQDKFHAEFSHANAGEEAEMIHLLILLWNILALLSASLASLLLPSNVPATL